MQQLNRREWIRLLGLASAATTIGSLPAKAAIESIPYPFRPLLDGKIARLSANENPYGPSAKMRDAIIKSFDVACRYPFSQEDELATILAAKEGVKPENIVLTAGSTEGLKAAGLTFGLHGGEIISANPTFLALMDYAANFGAYNQQVSLDANLTHDLDAMEKRITSNTRLIFVCNPNNPTGTLLPAEKLRSFCKSVAGRAMIFCDEAYFDYITIPNYPSMTELVKEGYNVIVSRTFSKVYGMAGVRIGYLVARADIAERLRDNTMANISMLGLHAAKAALEDQEFYRFSIKKTEEAKKNIYKLLDELGLTYIPSHGNFIFFKTGRDIKAVQSSMAALNVQVGRPFPPFYQWCRISMGTPEEMDMFAQGLRKVMKA